MSMAEPRIADLDAVKAEWLDRLSALVSLIKGWVEASGWRTRLITKPVTEPGLGRYEVPLLLMKRGEVEVALSPVARTAPGADGVVDLYLMPAYDDLVSLSLEGGRWFIHSVFPPDPTAPRSVIDTEWLALDEDTINRVLDAVAARA
jgi:hypothetical protein